MLTKIPTDQDPHSSINLLRKTLLTAKDEAELTGRQFNRKKGKLTEEAANDVGVRLIPIMSSV